MDYVILPLYSTRYDSVAEKNGLNQRNAEGRDRHPDEVYIPIPQAVNARYPNFFPATSFTLVLPDSTDIMVSVCQEGNKATKRDPNRLLGNWILRQELHLPQGTLITDDILAEAGFDSVKVEYFAPNRYSIATSPDLSYADFINA